MRGAKKMDLALFKTVAYRFARGFVAGGVASMAAALQAGIVITKFEDLKDLGVVLFIAFVSGAVLALDKLIRGEKVTPCACNPLEK
jgi:hypothetical protein